MAHGRDCGPVPKKEEKKSFSRSHMMKESDDEACRGFWGAKNLFLT